MKAVFLAASLILLFSCTREKDEESVIINPVVPPDTLNAWKKYEAIAHAFITDIAFISPAKGFITSGHGIAASLDSGKTWTALSLGTPATNINSLFFYDQQNGYTVGDHSFGSTADGGNSWTFSSLTSSGYDVFFISPTTGFYAGQNGLYRTTNRGVSWLLNINASCTAVYFKNSSEGWAAGIGGQVYKTVDGGITWSATAGTFPPKIMAFGFSGQFGLATASDTLLRTNNNGSTWQMLPGFKAPFVDVDVLSPTLVYITSGSQIRKSTDGANSWTTEMKLGAEMLVEINFIDSLHGWATGTNGSVFRYVKN